MNDTGSSLVAVREKKLHKSGGCIGMFSQLFHWNRRFAIRNKQKLLTPAGSKQVSKNFGSEEKLPKFELIADKNIEVPDMNRNGILIPSCELKQGMLTPSLVARLMGLDSMPAVQRDKLKKTSCSKFVKLSTKYELRPQMMGASNSCAATSFEAEAAQCKKVLSQSRKCNQKLDSPVKSLSRRNASKLIRGATRILESGLQSKNRIKFVLSDSSKMDHTRTDKFRTEAPKASDGLSESSCFTNVSMSFSGQSSCRSCNNLLDIVESKQRLVEQPSVSHYVNHSFQGPSGIRPRLPMSSSLEAEKETLRQKSKKKSVDKDFIGLNQSSNDQAHSRMNFEVDSHKYDAEIEERDYFLPSTLKSSANVLQEGDAGFASSGKQFNINSDAMADKIMGGRVQSWTSIENKFTCGRESSNADGRVKMDDNAISFIPRSLMKQNVQIPEQTNERRDEDMAVGPHARNYSSCFAQTSNAYPRFKQVEAPQSYLNDNNDSLSPVSVLEVSFSNDSNFSGSLDNTPVYLHPARLMDCSNIKPQKLGPIFDSAISLSKESDGLELVTDLLNHTCEMLCRIEIVGSRLEGTKLDHAKEVILNAELLFGSAAQHDLDKTKGFSLSHFLTHQLEAVASILWTSSSCLIGFENGNENSLQGFFFDCIIEYIDSRYSPCFKYRSKMSGNLASQMNAEKLIKEVDKEIRSWGCVAGLVPDKLIEREMSCCQQNSFKEEAYETSVEIAENIFQFLMNEIIKDLSHIKL